MRKIYERAAALARARPSSAAALVAGGLFLALHPISFLAPTAVAWLLEQDAATHYLGWQFFRSDPVTWPLGQTSSYLYPFGTSIGQTDSIPLVALLLRPIAALLPAEFQYLGPWLLFAWLAQGVVAFRLLSPPDRRGGARALLASALLVASPAIMYREALRHEALSAHAFLLAGFALYRADVDRAQPAILAVALIGIAGLVHPYFVLMTAAIVLARVVRAAVEARGPPPAGLVTNEARSRRSPGMAHSRGLRAAVAAAGLGGGLALAAVDIWAVGYLSTGAAQSAGGFGECASDLFAFANPMMMSSFVRGFPALPCRHEGYAYLGLGLVLAIAVALAWAGRKRVRFAGIGGVTAWPLWATAFVLWMFALSSNVTAFHSEILDLSALYARLEPVPSILRSSGRFVWPLYYLVAWWALERLIAGARPQRSAAILLGCFVLQAIDIGPAFFERFHRWTAIAAPDVEHLWPIAPPPAYRHLALYRPTFIGTRCAFSSEAYVTAARLAAIHQLTFNGGYAARVERDAVAAYCDRFIEALGRGEIASDTIYVFSDEPPPGVFDALRCATFHGVRTCVARTNNDPFAESLGP